MIGLVCCACSDDQITGWPAVALLVMAGLMTLAVVVFLLTVTWDVLHGS